MQYIQFNAPYEAAIKGRDVESAVHPEDDTGPGVAIVADADVRLGDRLITEAAYAAQVASITAANAARPAPPKPEDPDVVTLRAALTDIAVPAWAKVLIRRAGVR